VGADDGSNARRSAVALPVPDTSTNRRLAAISARIVSVMRSGGSAAVATAITQRDVSASAGEPGKIDAVWASPPIPSSTRSKAGRSLGKCVRSVSS